MIFKAKKGKNKYNMFEWSIKKSPHLKIHFTVIKTKTLTAKSWLFDPMVGLCQILDHLVEHIFPFEMIVYRPNWS